MVIFLQFCWHSCASFFLFALFITAFSSRLSALAIFPQNFNLSACQRFSSEHFFRTLLSCVCNWDCFYGSNLPGSCTTLEPTTLIWCQIKNRLFFTSGQNPYNFFHSLCGLFFYFPSAPFFALVFPSQHHINSPPSKNEKTTKAFHRFFFSSACRTHAFLLIQQF